MIFKKFPGYVFTRNKLIQLSFLVLILLLSLWTRLFQLGHVPNGIAPDEADMGYTAYSIMKTGKDIYGRSYPLFPQALDDYKPGLAVYSTIPAIYLFGLNDFAIRITPALLGSFIPLLMFFLMKLMYPKNQNLAYVSATLTAFSPWSIQMSRAMIWYTEMIFFYLLSLSLFLYSINNNYKIILISAIFLSLTPYIYHASFIYTPVTIIFLTVIYRKEIFKNYKLFLAFILLLLILSIPAILNYHDQLGRRRFNAISVLNPDITLPTSISEMKYDLENKISFSTANHNRRFVYMNSIIENYVSYFNLDYLFVNSKNVRYFYVNNIGLFYLLELPLTLLGLYLIIQRRNRSDLLILGLLLIAPIPAMITLGKAFIHRGLLLIPMFQIISAVGVVSLNNFIKKLGMTFGILMVTLYGMSIYFFLHQYFIHSSREFTSEKDNGAWFSTVREVIPLINDRAANYDKVIFTWSSEKLVPGAYFAFYNKVDPTIMQTKAARWKKEPPSYKQIYDKVGNIEFRHISWQEDQKLRNVLFVGYPEEFPKDIQNIVAKTYLPNGEVHFLLVENR